VTIVFLALLTLIEGVRRVPRGSVVLHRVLFGQWTVEPPEAGDRVRLLSWWSPLMSSIVLATREKYRRTDADTVRAQVEGRDLYTALFDLRVLGIVELLVLVLGVWFALERFGALGFFVAGGTVLLLCVTIFTALAFSAHGLGRPWRAALPGLTCGSCSITPGRSRSGSSRNLALLRFPWKNCSACRISSHCTFHCSLRRRTCSMTGLLR